MNKKNKNYLKIIDKIQDVRQTNNKNWMDLLRLSFTLDPKKSKRIVKEIFKRDSQISALVKQLTK